MLLRTYRPNQATTGFHIRLLFYIPWVRIPEPNRDRKEGRKEPAAAARAQDL